MAVLQGHIVGLGADDGLIMRKFFDCGIEVWRPLLGKEPGASARPTGNDKDNSTQQSAAWTDRSLLVSPLACEILFSYE